MCVENPCASTPEPQSATLEDEKHEKYRPKFDRFAREWFTRNNNAIVSRKGFAIMAISPCTYSGAFGKVHKPSSATLLRYIDEENSELNPSGMFHFTTTTAGEAGIEFVGDRQDPRSEVSI